MAVQPGDPEALLLYQLIGAPLLAVVQAEAQAAQVSAEFIQRVGFRAAPADQARPADTATGLATTATGTAAAEPAQTAVAARTTPLHEGGQIGELRTADFVMSRSGPDGKPVNATVSVPVLSLFPIPLLQVKDAEFDFDIRVMSRVPLQTPDDSRLDVQTGHMVSKDFLAPDRVELKGMLAPRGGSQGGTVQMGMKVKIRMEQADLPTGLTRLMALLDQGVSVTPKE